MLSDAQVGAWVRRYRDKHGLSQADVAAMLGCTQPSLSKIEHGRRKLTAAELLALQARRP